MNALASTYPAIHRVVLLLMIISFISGCSTMKPLPSVDRATVSSHVELGDKVEITRNDGGVVKFKVSEITDTGVGGDGHFIAYADMRDISSKQFSAAATLGLAVGVLAIVTLVVSAGLDGTPTD